ncbi:MAG: ABC transporter substrate-binding protein [Rhodocyclaceae bacterium]
MRTRSRTALLLATTSLTALLAACTPPEPIRLGFIGGLSGRVADLGESARNGFQLAIEQANAAGGINGRRIEMLVKDDAQDPAKARQAAEALAAAGVTAIIGPVTSAMAEPVLTAATAAGLPVVSPTVTTSALTGKDDLFLRVTEDTRGYSDLAANHHFRKTGLRRVAIVFDTRNRAYTEDWVQGFRLSFTGLGGKVVAEVPFESGDMPNHPALVRELLAGKPDGLVFVSSAIDAARFAQAARDAGARQTLIGVEWAATERFIELGGKAVDGVYLTQFFDRQSAAPEFQSMRQAYEARFKAPPGFASVGAYDATSAVLQALAQKGSGTLKQALLEKGPFKGSQQPVQFDRFGDARRQVFITVIRDGQFVVE